MPLKESRRPGKDEAVNECRGPSRRQRLSQVGITAISVGSAAQVSVWTWQLILFAVRHWNAADVDEDESEETKDKRCSSHIPRSCTGRFRVFNELLRPTNESTNEFDVSPLHTHLDEHPLQTHLKNHICIMSEYSLWVLVLKVYPKRKKESI